MNVELSFCFCYPEMVTGLEAVSRCFSAQVPAEGGMCCCVAPGGGGGGQCWGSPVLSVPVPGAAVSPWGARGTAEPLCDCVLFSL